MSGPARVLVYYQAPPGDSAAVERAYHEASASLHDTPGLVRNELLRDTLSPGRYAVLSEWDSEAAFISWERGPDHRRQTAPLHAYLSGNTARVGVYAVVAGYSGRRP